MDVAKCNKHVENTPEYARLTSDVYFLIQRFLSTGPLRRTLQTLNEDLEEFQILPRRIDWEGNEHHRSVEDMQRQYPCVRQDFLYYLCSQASIHLNPNPGLVSSFLSFRPKARNKNGVCNNYRQYFSYVIRSHGAPIQDTKSAMNIVNSIRGREVGGPLTRHRMIAPKIYSGMQIQRITIGHLSAVYCLLFDHSGRYVITGADDLLIKLWSTHTGRLIAAFRGASSEITDIAIDPDNYLLAAGSIDRILRVWNLQNGGPIAVLTGHTGMITSVNFCPTACWGNKYLISTSTDGSIAFWTYHSDGVDSKVDFRNTPVLYQEKIRPGQAQMICSSFSPGGTFLATGSADHHVRVYYMKGDEGPQRILETEAHTDRVDSIQWAHSGLKFLSGSKDGTAIIWWFERQQWKSILLDMTTKLPNDKQNSESDIKKIRVTMVAWDRSDSLVVTAVSDHTMKVWTSDGKLLRILTGHTDEVYVLEPHPHDEDVILSAGHDGQLLIWDVHRGEILFKYFNTIEGQGYGAIFDAKWSPDGSTISASDSHGDILTFGFGTGSPFYQQLPKELFFHTDYRPLVRDQNYWVLDEQTQVPPHLMPPPFLVDIDGNPYPPMLQRLVPGRENCNVEQLVPNIVIGNEGIQEVIQDVSHRIMEDSEDEDVRGNAGGSLRSQRIRQSTGDWQTDHNIEWKKNVLLQPLSASVLERSNEVRVLTEDAEMKEYQKQLRKRPLMISTAGPSNVKSKEKKKRPTKRPKKERSIRPLDSIDLDRYDVVPLSDAYCTDESSFSDWAEEISESRKRRSKRRNNNTYNRSRSSSDNDDDDELTEDTDHTDDNSDDMSGFEKQERKPRKHRENNKVTKEKGKSRASPKPSTSKQSGSSKASVPRNQLIPKKDPIPKTAQTAKLTAAEPSTSGVASTSKGPKIKISEQYKLSEWLAETRPRKSPYYPQIYDEIVYFVQGHILYVEAVKVKNVYDVNIKELPWVKGMQLKDHEFCKVVGIRYEIKPPRLCCLKLALQDETGALTGKTFTIKFHDMPDVLDFFVLKQCYLTALSRAWQAGDKFRCMIDDNWWIGEITTKSPASDLYPESVFMCYEIIWINEERERMSPWDMEPLDGDRLPEDEKAAMPVLANELRSILYKPVAEDWPNCERDTACKAIARGITQVMELAIAEPFLVPVDINVYPTYALVVEYPIDLSTIKARFENNFYRRLSAAQFDIRYLETNAEKFNEQHSIIVRHAKILTELCLRIVKSGNNAIDIASIYHQLVDGFDMPSSTDEEIDVELTQPSTSRAVRYLPVRSWKSPDDWKIEASGLLELMWQTEDSVPFRDPVDKHKYPTYHLVIRNPMDLGTVRDKLQKGEYHEPKDFCLDMRLIFQNSRTFNTNKRSRIYVMTVRLFAMFEEHIKKIMFNWRIAMKRQRRLATSSDDSDANASSSEKSQNIEFVNVTQLEAAKNGSVRGGSDSDSDNTPLDVLKAMSRSNTATESDTNTLDKVASFVTAEEDETVYSNQKDDLNMNGGEELIAEASPSSESLTGDCDHNYTNKRLTADGYEPPPNGKSKEDDSDAEKPSTSNSKDRKPEPLKYIEKESSDDDYVPPRQSKILKSESESSSESDDFNNFNAPSSSKSKRLDNEYRPQGRRRLQSSSDSDEDSLSLLQLQSGLRKRKGTSEDEDEDFCPEDSSGSSRRRRRRKDSSDEDFEVYNRKNKRIRKRRPSFVVEEDDDEDVDNMSSEGSSSNTDSSDDDVPLRKAGLRRRPKKNRNYMTSDSDSESTLRPQRKRRRVLVSESFDSDVDSRGTNGRPGYFESVSSRGRVRKITERAAAFLKKDKKAG